MLYVNMKRKFYRLFVVTVSVFFLGACSLNKLAVHIAANALTGNGSSTVFTGDDDPDLIADALPFALKMYESLLESDPDNVALLTATGSGYISYAKAFLQSPAELMDYDRQSEKNHLLSRAAGLYGRGGRFMDRAVEIRHPGLMGKLKQGDLDGAFSDIGDSDVPLFYWKSAAVLGEFSIDSFNPEIMLNVPEGVAYLTAAFSIDPDYDSGALHEIFISIFASIPDSLIYGSDNGSGGFSVRGILREYYEKNGVDFNSMSNREKAYFHFKKAVELSSGNKVSPYVSYATSVCIREQNYALFKELLGKAVGIDINKDPADRLINVIGQRKALWYLDHAEDFFILP